MSSDPSTERPFDIPFPGFAVPHETAADKHPTRKALMTAAIEACSLTGFDGVTIRDIERRAGVNRGLVAHHFGSKEALWEAAVDAVMRDMADELRRYWDFLGLVSEAERARILLRIYVHFISRHPEFFRIVLIEGREPSRRCEILTERYMRPLGEMFRSATGVPDDEPVIDRAIWHFLMFGASSAIFGVPAHTKLLFGVDPTDADFVERFADTVADVWMALADRQQRLTPSASDDSQQQRVA